MREKEKARKKKILKFFYLELKQLNYLKAVQKKYYPKSNHSIQDRSIFLNELYFKLKKMPKDIF